MPETHAPGAPRAGLARQTGADAPWLLASLAGRPRDPRHPMSGLARGPGGTLYASSSRGGIHDLGVIFGIDRQRRLRVLHMFGERFGADGAHPMSPPLRMPDGTLYGVTLLGGAFDRGVVYALSPTGAYRVLHSFHGGAGDGAHPSGALSLGPGARLYGLTQGGGPDDAGVLYSIAADGRVRMLHAFGAAGDLARPAGRLLLGRDGSLYGTALSGGTHRAGGVFRFTASGHEQVLVSLGRFPGDARNPSYGVVSGPDGALYTATPGGGSLGRGALIRLSDDGGCRVLHSFGSAGDGSLPSGRLVLGADAALYGLTTLGGRCQRGTAYRVTPQGRERPTHSFCGDRHGAVHPRGALLAQACGTAAGLPPMVPGRLRWLGLSSGGGEHGGGALFGLS